MPKRTKKVKAKAKWSTWTTDGEIVTDRKLLPDSEPVWSPLPRTAADYDAMVEQMAAAIGTHSYKRCKWSDIPDTSRPYYRNEASAALRAIGITRPKEAKP